MSRYLKKSSVYAQQSDFAHPPDEHGITLGLEPDARCLIMAIGSLATVIPEVTG